MMRILLFARKKTSLEEFVLLFELFNEATALTHGESYTTVNPVAFRILGFLLVYVTLVYINQS